MSRIGRPHTPLYWTNERTDHDTLGVLSVFGYKIPLVLPWGLWLFLGIASVFQTILAEAFDNNNDVEMHLFGWWFLITLGVALVVGLIAVVKYTVGTLRKANHE